jgi:hypothetical protein
MGLSEKSFEFFKKFSHRFPKSLFRLANESFEVTRGYLSSINSNSKVIKKTQRQLLQKNFARNTKSLTIFLTPGIDMVNGGILSITSLFEETKRLKYLHGSEVILCTYPSDPHLLKYTKFKNNNPLYNFSDVLRFFSNIDNLLIHVPEHFIYRFSWFTSKADRAILSQINNVQINVMIQNIDYLPSNRTILRLQKLGKLTSTTAHSKYSTIELKNRLGFPLHQLSVYVSPEQYYFRKFREKENLMIVSPDQHPRKKEILKLVEKELPLLKIKIIKNLTYEEYKETISRAKWALTFGEGLDGYFVETIFSGGIGFSVYNAKYFTKEFGSLRTVYGSYAILIQNLCKDILELDDEKAYSVYQNRQFDLCSKRYDYRNYLKNLEAFYKGEYTYK